MALAWYRALKPLQAPSLGRVNEGQKFQWDGPVLGWPVQGLDQAARDQLAAENRNPDGDQVRVRTVAETMQGARGGLSASAAFAGGGGRPINVGLAAQPPEDEPGETLAPPPAIQAGAPDPSKATQRAPRRKAS